MAKVSRYYDVKRDTNGHRYLEVAITGFSMLRLPLLNKSTAFTLEERELLEVDGLIPPHVSTMQEQKIRQYERYQAQSSDLEKHIFLRNLQDRNEVLFFKLLEDHLEEMMPIIYTPTVGDAVKLFSQIYRFPRGLTVSTGNVDRLEQTMQNVPLEDVRMIVATDSSAILGIGDQGFGGMAISIGKLSLYTVAGGVGPDKTLPVELDVGTDREDLLADPLYLGTHHRRLEGEAYIEFIDKFVESIISRYPKTIIQWEDFARGNAFKILERYRRIIPSFNDDIQGTGAMALAGVINACKIKGERLEDQRFVVVGAGAGGIGVAWAIKQGLIQSGLSELEARAQIFVVDRFGLLVSNQALEDHQWAYSQEPAQLTGWTFAGHANEQAPSLLETVQNARATVLLGLSGQPGLFSEAVIRAMGANAERPIIFPLSNPTAHVEAQPADVLDWTEGRALVATGSPFADVMLNGKTHPIGQGNNAFIFPGLGFGAVLARAREITDGMVLEAAATLAEQTTLEHLAAGRVYPPMSDLREVSIKVAARVMHRAIRDGVAAEYRVRNMNLEQLETFARSRFWAPKYLPFKRG